MKKLKLTLRKLSAEPFPTTKCYKLTVGDHPVIYYKTTVDVEDVRAYVIACYIYSGDMLTMFTAQLYDAESFEAWNSAINEMTISGEQLGVRP